MLNALFGYKVKGLTKEQIIAEFDNLLSWEKNEVIKELNRKMKYRRALEDCSTNELYYELSRRGE